MKKIYTRTAQPAQLPGKLTIAPSFDVHLFFMSPRGTVLSHKQKKYWANQVLPCITGVLVLELTCIRQSHIAILNYR